MIAGPVEKTCTVLGRAAPRPERGGPSFFHKGIEMIDYLRAWPMFW